MPDPAAATASLDAFLAQYYTRHPVNATFTGVHTHDPQLPDWSAEGRAQDAAEMRALRALLAAETPTTDTLLAQANLDVRLAEYESSFFQGRNPALWTGEAIFGAVSLMARSFAPVQERVPLLVARLQAIPPFLDSMRQVLSPAVPERWTRRALRECRAARRLFGEGLDTWLRRQVHARLHSRVQAAARQVCAAFHDCEHWLETVPAAAPDQHAAGAALFDVLLQRGHLCSTSRVELRAAAEESLRTAQASLAGMAGAAGGTWGHVQQQLALLHPTVETYYQTFTDTWQACHSLAREHDLVSWPDWPIRYIAIPEWARNAAPDLYWLFYRSPAPFDAYTQHDYLVSPVEHSLGSAECTNRLRAWNLSVIKSNHVVHHGGLGHHVQNWHATHQTRSRIGAIAAVDCASRIGMFLGGTMAEGWACYAMELADEFGFFSPLERVAQQHSRVRMLVRAIVDIRMHTEGLDVLDAVALYVEQAGMSLDAAEAEVTRNSMFPGTALMYWLGTKGILDLRAELQRRQGTAFRLRTFHDELLSHGSVPVALIARTMLEGVPAAEPSTGIG